MSFHCVLLLHGLLFSVYVCVLLELLYFLTLSQLQIEGGTQQIASPVWLLIDQGGIENPRSEDLSDF